MKKVKKKAFVAVKLHNLLMKKQPGKTKEFVSASPDGTYALWEDTVNWSAVSNDPCLGSALVIKVHCFPFAFPFFLIYSVI